MRSAAPVPALWGANPAVAWSPTAATDKINFGSASILDSASSPVKASMGGWFCIDDTAVNSSTTFFGKEDTGATLGWLVRLITTTGVIRVTQYTSSTSRTYNSVEAPCLLALNKRWVYLGLALDSSLGAGVKYVGYYGAYMEPLTTLTWSVSNEGAGVDDTDAANNLNYGNRGTAGGEAQSTLQFGPCQYWNNRILTKSQFQEQALNPLRPVAYPTIWAFPDPAGNAFLDLSGNGLHGAITGGKWVPMPGELAKPGYDDGIWAYSNPVVPYNPPVLPFLTISFRP